MLHISYFQTSLHTLCNMTLIKTFSGNEVLFSSIQKYFFQQLNFMTIINYSEFCREPYINIFCLLPARICAEVYQGLSENLNNYIISPDSAPFLEIKTIKYRGGKTREGNVEFSRYLDSATYLTYAMCL